MGAGLDHINHEAGVPDADEHDFHLGVEPLNDHATVVSVGGELDLSTVPALRGALVGALDRGITRLVIDLTHVTFVDSVGVGAILHTKRRLGAGGVLAVVLAPSTYARVIFDVVGADSVVEVFETRAQAAARVAA
ncbi:MAG: anti-sigma factor antagonist [Solirubrobacteraceae bacterium]|jgi:anti-sigma B factor antagonist|nr:anti-sigma factor antagonist [Solirubrobacteraceae bacterium]